MKKLTFVFAMLLMTFLATNNVLAQINITGKWKFNDVKMKPLNGQAPTDKEKEELNMLKEIMFKKMSFTFGAKNTCTFDAGSDNGKPNTVSGTYNVDKKNKLTFKMMVDGKEQNNPMFENSYVSTKGKQLTIESIIPEKGSMFLIFDKQ